MSAISGAFVYKSIICHRSFSVSHFPFLVDLRSFTSFTIVKSSEKTALERKMENEKWKMPNDK